MKTWIGILAVFFSTACSLRADYFDQDDRLQPAEVRQALEEDGLGVRVHGLIPGEGLLTVSLRDQDNFFNFEIFPVFPSRTAPELKDAFGELNRHDKIRLWGRLVAKGPQLHLIAKEMEVLEDLEPLVEENLAIYGPQLPQEGSAKFLIHAVDVENSLLVLERNFRIYPLPVEGLIELEDLYRNDLVGLSFKTQEKPNQPQHLELQLDDNEKSDFEVLESIEAYHEEPAVREGLLIRFPKSPQVLFDVYAILQEIEPGLYRYFTLVNFEDPEVFMAVRQKAEDIWKASEAEVVSFRNKEFKRGLRVRAEGVYNVVSAQQANPQIVLESVDSLTKLEP